MLVILTKIDLYTIVYKPNARFLKRLANIFNSIKVKKIGLKNQCNHFFCLSKYDASKISTNAG